MGEGRTGQERYPYRTGQEDIAEERKKESQTAYLGLAMCHRRPFEARKPY